ncbi:MAG: site-specific integrase [Acidimicrobiales bacterium]
MESGKVDAAPVQSQKSTERFAEYAARWVEHRTLRPRTIELYELQLRLHINPTLGDAKVARLKPAHVREWHSNLSKGPLHPTTVSKVYRLLRSILNTAVEDGILDSNPCRIAKAGVEHSKERPIPTVDQLYALAEAMPPHLAAAVWIAALGGLRKGEILGLARKHIDLDARTITVERALQEITGQGAVLVEPKTMSSNRIVFMPEPLAQTLAAHLTSHVKEAANSLLFTNNYGRPIRATVWVKAWDMARNPTGLEQIRFHDLRHLAGTLTAQAGATLKEVMAALGHSTPDAALRYQHVAQGRASILAERIASQL